MFPGFDFDKNKFAAEVMDTIGKPFCNDRKAYPVDPVTDPVQVAKEFHQKYRSPPSSDLGTFLYRFFDGLFSVLGKN
jgi:hypothetical protein